MSNDIRSPAWVTVALNNIGSGGQSARAIWKQMLEAFQAEPLTKTATTAQLAAVGDAINTSDNKVAGYMVWNSTTGIPVWADGPADADTWSGSDGVVDHTPV